MTDYVFFQILNQTPSVELPLVSYLITVKRKATYIITLASSGHGHYLGQACASGYPGTGESWCNGRAIQL